MAVSKRSEAHRRRGPFVGLPSPCRRVELELRAPVAVPAQDAVADKVERHLAKGFLGQGAGSGREPVGVSAAVLGFERPAGFGRAAGVPGCHLRGEDGREDDAAEVAEL